MCASLTCSDQEKEVFTVVVVTHCISVLLNILNDFGLGAPDAEAGRVEDRSSGLV